MSAPGSAPINAPPLPQCWSHNRPDGCWQLALESGGDGVYDWNILSEEVFFGPRFNALLGFVGESIGHRGEDFRNRVHPDDNSRLNQRVSEHCANVAVPWRCDLRLRNRAGEYQWVEMRGAVVEHDADGRPARMIGTLRDIDTRYHDDFLIKQQLAATAQLNQQLEGAQVQLVQSEKLAAIGQLAAGVAHELKTPIGFVGTNFGTLERYAGSMLSVLDAYRSASSAADPASALAAADALYAKADIDYLRTDLPDLFAESRDGLDRVQRIVRDLKDFSRVGEQEWQFADLHQGLDSTINILRYEIKHKAVVERRYGDLPKVWCVPSMVNQVFLNLLANAAQAIENQGVITVESAVEDDCAVIRIADTGSGMTPEVLSRIFEPFFTTKGAGKGTGLGLSLAQDIVHQHRGRLWATSTPGQGSTFSMVLPLSGLQSLDPAAPTDSGLMP
ncbi:PAS domain-containing sensor histidine kinase [Azoarcus sp. L1K30]|uniref:ATP-binding protein n=1 Tax=Azoarcus sp. L1K30 TaxID=2820277 RepID=UPI001B80F12F|nr:ATP-binding protein [Azoarcus sp. L1K30]MBR0564496.1 PAS domain-containing sensor histidine kinase [Azoarcus sp. L1K30]